MSKQKTIFVAMSGGVDSSVAAALLKKQGHNVVGAHMKCYNVDGCAAGDAEDARRVAEQLSIPFYVFDFEKEYKQRVVEYMIDGYRKGITPNPDVMCNKEIKFGMFLEKALALGADYVATGHYVRIVKRSNLEPRTSNLFALHVARDKNKDQSYFLWTLTQKQLKHCLFPIGDYTKPQVRKLAKKFGLLTAEKKDSQGVCFLGKISLEDFLKKYIKEKPGNILDEKGNIVGRHRGVQHYTIGQRRLGIKNMALGIKGTHETTPHFVVAKDIKANTITISPAGDESLYKKEIAITNINWITKKPSQYLFKAKTKGHPSESWINSEKVYVYVRIRYRQPLVNAVFIGHPSSDIGHLVFKNPQQYIAPGQSAVFYNNKGKLLGGGIIA